MTTSIHDLPPAPASEPSTPNPAAHPAHKPEAHAAHKPDDAFESGASLHGSSSDHDYGNPSPEALLSDAAQHPSNPDWQHVAEKTVDVGAHAISDARSRYDHALAARQGADQRLSKELAVVGPGLDQQQRQQFVQRFHDRHQDVYRTARDAAAHLDAELKKWSPALEEAAKTGVPKGAADKLSEVVKGYQSLAQGPRAEDALRWAGHVSRDAHLAAQYAHADKHLVDHLQQVLSDATTHGAAQALANHHGDARAALAEITNLLQPLQNAASLGNGLFGLKDLGDDLTHFRQGVQSGIKTFDALSRGDTTTLKELQQGWEHKSAMEKSLAAAGLVFGVAAAGTDAAGGQFGQALVQISGSSQQIAELSARALGTYAEAGKLAAQAAGRGAEFLARFAPGLGVLASGVSVYLDAKAAAHGDPGAVISIVGDSLSAVGSAIEVIPGAGTFIGGVINGIGSAISFGGMVLDTILGIGSHEQSPGSEAHDILQQMGLRDPAASALAYADPKMLQDLRGAVKGAPDPARVIQQILGRYPELAHHDTPGPARQLAELALDVARRLHVRPDRLGDFLDHLARAGTRHPGDPADWAALATELLHVDEELRGLNRKVQIDHHVATGPKFDQVFNAEARALLNREFPWLRALES